MKTIIFAALLLILPASASAYISTGQQAIRVNDTTALFFIEYEFGHESHDLFLPVLAKRGQDHGTEAKTIGFELLEEGSFVNENASVQAAVISEAPIENGMYKVPKGYATTFRFAAIVTTDPDADEVDYSIQITDLPFYFDGMENKQQLNPSELRYYRTEEVELNGENPSKYPLSVPTVTASVRSIEYTVLD